MSLIGDSSDKPKEEIRAAPMEKLDEILDRANKGWALTVNEVKLLANIIKALKHDTYHIPFYIRDILERYEAFKAR